MYNNIGYIRVSTNVQNNSLSKETQINNITQYINLNNLHLDYIVEDTGTAYNKKSCVLLNLLNNNKKTNILVSRIDRFSRNISFANDYFNIMEKNSINLIGINENVNSINLPDKQKILKFIISGQFESDILSFRINESIKTRKRKKSYIGNPPYGKKIIIVKKIRKCIVNKKEKQIIKFIKDFKSCLFSSTQLTKKLKEIKKENIDKIEFIDEYGIKINYITKPHNISYQDIADLLNSYNIYKRKKRWTKNSFYNLINKKVKTKKVNNNIHNNIHNKIKNN